MADRVSASIIIGGELPRSLLAEFLGIIELEGVSTEWDGEAFDAAQLVVGEPLSLMANEVAWGRFDALESFCVRHGLGFARWSGGCPGTFGAERVVYDGLGRVTCFAATEDDVVMISRETIDLLGSIGAIREHLDRADRVVPPLRVIG